MLVRKRWMLALFIAFDLMVMGLVGVAVIARTDSPPETIGFGADDQLAPCPDSPNCVASQRAAPEQTLPPLDYSGSRAEARTRLLAIVENMPRSTVLANEESYLHIQFRSRVFGFGDDLEFYLPPDENSIYFRSAARMGYSDMGVNRERIEEIRAAFEQE